MRLLPDAEAQRVRLWKVQAENLLQLPVSNPTHNKTQCLACVCFFVWVWVCLCVCACLCHRTKHTMHRTQGNSVSHTPQQEIQVRQARHGCVSGLLSPVGKILRVLESGGLDSTRDGAEKGTARRKGSRTHKRRKRTQEEGV